MSRPRPTTGAEGFDRPLTVRTARLAVRPLVRADREEWVRVTTLSAPLVGPWNPTPSGDPGARFDRAVPVGPDLANSLPAHSLPEFADSEFRNAGLAERRDLRLAGFLEGGTIACLLSLTEIVRGPFQNAYAGWSVNADLAGQGFATEGVDAMLRIAFAEPPRGLGLHRVQANILPRNEASVRLARRCGFRLEGLGRAYLKIAGAWEDHGMWAIVAEEWAG